MGLVGGKGDKVSGCSKIMRKGGHGHGVKVVLCKAYCSIGIGWSIWQISQVSEGADFLRYPDGSSSGTPNIPDLIKTPPTAHYSHKKTNNLASIKKFAKF